MYFYLADGLILYNSYNLRLVFIRLCHSFYQYNMFLVFNVLFSNVKMRKLLEHLLNAVAIDYYDYDYDLIQGRGRACIPHHIQTNYNSKCSYIVTRK